MRLRDLLDISELRLELRCGAEALDRPIRWVYTTEIVEPGRYLSGNELVLTGLMWLTAQQDAGFVPARRTPGEFVATLVDAGVTALGISTAVHGHLPAEIVEACKLAGLPLLEVPAAVSFGTVSEVVTQRLTAERAAGLSTVLGRRRRLISSVAEGAGLTDVFALTREELGRGCWVLTPAGRVVAGPAEALSEETARMLAAEFLTAERLPHVVSDAYTLLPINTRAGHRIATWFLVCEGAPPGDGGWEEAGEGREASELSELRETAYELAALAALERARLEEGRRVERRLVAELIEVAGRADPGEIQARMRTCGLPSGTPYVAVAAAVSDVAHPGEVGCTVLEELIGGVGGADGVAGVAGVVGGEALALVPTAAESLVAGLRAGVERLAPGSRPGQITIGVSGTAQGAGALAGVIEEARHTRRMAELGGTDGRTPVVSSDEIHSFALLLATVPDGVRRSFRDRLLRPLHAYDSEHHSDLVHTLETFLDASGSWNRCAAQLHVHVNTLRYRIRRIEELTGRDLGTLENRVDFFLALRAT